MDAFFTLGLGSRKDSVPISTGITFGQIKPFIQSDTNCKQNVSDLPQIYKDNRQILGRTTSQSNQSGVEECSYLGLVAIVLVAWHD